MEYIAAGNFMLDSVKFYDGATNPDINLGGPATFAFTGIKLFTDKVVQCSNIGEDGRKQFYQWAQNNEISMEHIKIKCEHSNHSYLNYNEDGTYSSDMTVKRFRSDWIQDFGYMKTSPKEIGEVTFGKNVKGVYIAQNVDSIFWNDLGKIKQRDGFKLMWEIEAPSSHFEYLPKVIECLNHTDIFSINLEESKSLFDVSSEVECIDALQALPVPLTLFRVGSKGVYVITSKKVIHLPPANLGKIVDPTGCGNTSTGAALYAYCEFDGDPLAVGVYANVAAAQNIRGFGLIDNFSKLRVESINAVKDLMKNYKEEL